MLITPLITLLTQFVCVLVCVLCCVWYVLSYFHAGDHLLRREFHTHYCLHKNYGPTFIPAAVKGVANAVSQVATIKHGKYLCADARWGGQARYIRALVWWSSRQARCRAAAADR